MAIRLRSGEGMGIESYLDRAVGLEAKLVDGVIWLRGNLTDHVAFFVLEDAVGESSEINLDGIARSSILGINKFISFLEAQDHGTVLQNIPYHIYRDLRLALAKSSKIGVKSIKVESLRQDNRSQVGAGQCVFEVGELKELKNQGLAFQKIPSFGALRDHLRFLVPDEIDRHADHGIFENPWAKENGGEANFWYGFLHFLETNVRDTFEMLSSLQDRLVTRLTHVQESYKKLESSPRIMARHPDSNSLAMRVSDLLAELQIVCGGFNETLGSLICEIDDAIDQGQRMLMEGKSKRGNGMTGLILDLCEKRVGLVKVIALIEEVATASLSKLVDMAAVDTFVRAVEMLDTEIGGDLLAVQQVREELRLTDPLANHVWYWTKEEIIQTINETEEEINACVIDLQEFDRVRQVVEHTVFQLSAVANVVEEIKQGRVVWSEARETIVVAIERTLLTEIEKASYSFYVNEGKGVEKDRQAEAGDIILF